MSDARPQQRRPGVPAAESGRGRGGGGGGNGNGVAGYSRALVWLACIVAAFAVAVPLLLSPYALQVVKEGSVGVLWFGGRLLDETKPPGFHYVLPFFYELSEVSVNVRTTDIRDVECGTAGGVLVHLPLVEIVHRLHLQSVVSTLRAYEDYEQTWIIERVRHDAAQICARHSLHDIHIDKFDQLDDMLVDALKETVSVWVPGLQIIAARVAKPRIPEQLQGDFVRVEEETSKLKIAHQHEQLVIRNAETERSKQVMAAERNRDIGSMTMAREMDEKTSDLHIQRIQDEMHVSRSKDHADAASYSKLREAEGNEQRLSPAFLELERHKALYENLEAYYGDRMPEYIHDRSSPSSSSSSNSDDNDIYGGGGGGGGGGGDSGNMARGAADFWRKRKDRG